MSDRPEATRAVAAALDHALDRLSGRGVSDLELGRAAVAAGLSRLSRSMSAAELSDHLAGIAVSLVEAGNENRPRPN